MRFLKENRGITALAAVILAVLAVSFFAPHEAPERETLTPQIETEELTAEEPPKAEEIPSEEPKKENMPKAEETPSQESPKAEEEKELYCTLSVRCDTILEDITRLDENKRGLVGENGVIFPQSTVKFHEGESVFDVLLREMKENGIHMEFVNTPMYGSVYIEGIGNIYEFDAGELSGWMYKVNGEFPNYGCSKYILKSGDKVEFVYTCDLGKDVGGDYYANNGE